MTNDSKRKAVAFICILLVLVMILGIILPFFVNADILDEEEKLKQLEYEQQLNTALTKQQKQQLEKLQKELTTLEADLLALDKQVTEVEIRMNELTDQIEFTKQEIADTKVDLAAAQEKEAAYQIVWAERLQAMYESPAQSVWELLLTSQDFKDFWVKMDYQRAVVEYDNRIMHGIEDNRKQIETDLAVIEQDEILLEEALAEATVEEQELMALRQNKNTKLAEIAAKTASVQAQLERLIIEEAALASQKSMTQARINELKSIEAEARKYQENHLTGAYTTAAAYRAAQEALWYNKCNNKSYYNQLKGLYFLWPTKGNMYLTGTWGYWTNPVSKVYCLHTGIDIAARTGVKVYAAEAGVVLKAVVSYASTGYGIYLIIKHSDSVQTWYCHLSKLCVKEGDYVQRGDLIAESGSTGGATGPHLHFSLYINNVCVDPMLYITKTYPNV